jgi:transcriptional regulator with XRE-family HTH domain
MRTFRKFTPADYHVASKLKKFRTEIGMSQKQLGELTGLSFQQIQKYEAVENRITVAKLFEFSQILNRSVSAFYDGLKYDGKNYNYKLTTEKKRKKLEIEMDKELLPLIRAYNRIENKMLKRKIVALVQEISGPFYRKAKKHEYS